MTTKKGARRGASKPAVRDKVNPVWWAIMGPNLLVLLGGMVI